MPDLDPEELERHDPYFPLLLAVRAVKAGGRAPADVPAARVEGHLDQATCRSISGWAWDAARPEQRLRVELSAGDCLVGSAWCDQHRSDLAESGKNGGAVAFRFDPGDDIHEDPPARVAATAAGQTLTGSPQSVRCVCGRAAVRQADRAEGVRGAHLDTPQSGSQLGDSQVDVVGWVVGEDQPVEGVELLHRGEAFARVPVGAPRPDLEAEFPDVDWAGRAGFVTRLSLVGTGGELDLEVRAILSDGSRAPVATVVAHVADPPPAHVVAVLDTGAPGRNGSPTTLLDQRVPASLVLVSDAGELPGHPGFAPLRGGWNQVLSSPDGAMFWLASGRETVEPEFLGAAVARLAARPDASFVAAVDRAAEGSRGDLTAVLAGTALGYATVFRASATRAVGGLDESAGTAAMAQWDLAVRLVESGHEWVEIDGVSAEGKTIAQSSDEDSIRWLYRKHASLYRERLNAVLLEREATVGSLLRSNHLEERALESELRPRLRSVRRERDRLAAKLRARHSAARPESDHGSLWGDFSRFEPFSSLWGVERGLGVDRHYIERFLARNAADIRGLTLGCPDSIYVRRYGGERVERCDVFDPDPTNPEATLVSEPGGGDEIPPSMYDCIVLAHVLQHTFELAAALEEFRRILKPGGVLLATLPSVARIDPEYGLDHDYWRLSPDGLATLMATTFPSGAVDVRAEGNRTAAVAFLAGLAADEVGSGLDQEDPRAPLVVTCRAVAPSR